MSDTLDKYGGGIVVADRAPRDLSLVLGAVVADLPTLQERAAVASMQWRKFNSPSNFISHLLGRPAISAALPRPRQAAVIYPWGNASAEQAGSAMRMRFLVKYLEQQDFRVRVLFSSASGCGGTIGSRSTAEPYGYTRFGTRVLGFLLRKLAGLLGGTPVQSLHLWFHLWPRIDGRFAARCEEVIRWADEVYLEYSYFSSVVTGLCRRYNKPLVLTQHDILADQAKNVPLIYQLTRWLELRSLRQTPRVVACSRADAELCATHGINAEVIAHPMDIRDYYGLSPADAARILNDRLGIATHGTHVCFFVGSAHGPNRQAAQFIRTMASDLRSNHAADSIVFVVAGACMDRCDDGNFVSLGSIDDAGLAALYRMAAIVLVPLQEGTGSSVKSIEALARGAVVLSTTIGMRGIPVVAGRHGVIEDNLGAYPDRIFEIIQDTDKAASLRAAALQLGSDYDYRTVFAAYRSPDRTQGVHATPSHSPQSRETVLVRRVL
jgi:glycosyltransferase involved in cell wall biosynthesis